MSISNWEIIVPTHITHRHAHTQAHMQCRGDVWRGCQTCYGAQRAVLGAGALLKDTLAMPRMWTSILQLPVHIILKADPKLALIVSTTVWCCRCIFKRKESDTHSQLSTTNRSLVVMFLWNPWYIQWHLSGIIVTSRYWSFTIQRKKQVIKIQYKLKLQAALNGPLQSTHLGACCRQGFHTQRLAMKKLFLYNLVACSR